VIGAVLDTTKTLLRGKGFVEANGEDALQDRRYTIKLGPMESRNRERGGMGSGVIRVDRSVDVRVQYITDQKYERRLVDVVEDQKTIMGALCRSAALNAKLVDAGVEEVDGGIVSRITFSFPGQLS
jgi:hypothetical protein